MAIHERTAAVTACSKSCMFDFLVEKKIIDELRTNHINDILLSEFPGSSKLFFKIFCVNPYLL